MYKKSEENVPYKKLEENVMLRFDGKWINTKAVLSSCSGGKKVDYVTDDGTIIKSIPYCRSKYSRNKLDGK